MEGAIALVAEGEEANQAGDAGPLRAAVEGDEGQGHPEEGAQSSAGRAECAHDIEPGDPEGHNVDASTPCSASGHATRKPVSSALCF